MKEEAVKKFIYMLADEGDMFFSSGDTDTDYQTIKGTVESQGYWSGVKVRYYLDKDFNLLKIEERKFGNV